MMQVRHKNLLRVLSCLLFLWLLVSCMPLCVFAQEPQASHPDRLVDKADLLTAEEENTLRALLDEISASLSFDVVVVTVSDLEGASPMRYADTFYDRGGYGFGENFDGILFLRYINPQVPGQRDVWISTTGAGIKYFSDRDIQDLIDRMQDDILAGRYARAFSTFAHQVEEQVTYARSYKLYWIPISVAIGLAVGLLVTSSMRGALKSVTHQPYAGSYVRKNSFQLTRSRDTFLYRTVSRVPRAENSSSSRSSTHTSSSGRSHGGGGRHI